LCPEAAPGKEDDGLRRGCPYAGRCLSPPSGVCPQEAVPGVDAEAVIANEQWKRRPPEYAVRLADHQLVQIP
jgi:hypothetical protein